MALEVNTVVQLYDPWGVALEPIQILSPWGGCASLTPVPFHIEKDEIMNNENLANLGMALGCAVKVIVSTCIVSGQEKLAWEIVQMRKDERFDELSATFEAMSVSYAGPLDVKPS